MKTTSIIKTAMVAAVLYGTVASADTFTYNNGDLLAAFGKSGSSYDLIVDLGSAANYPASTFESPSGPFVIPGVNSTLLTSMFGGMDGIYWSVFGYVGTTGSPLGAQNTLFVAQPRDYNYITTQNIARHSLSYSAQGQVTSYMSAIADGAMSGTVLANQIVEVPQGLGLLLGDPASFTVGVNDFSGNSGNFGGTWIWDVRNVTPSGFATSSTPSVSDLFQENPGTANTANYLGNFELSNDGVLSFNPVPEPSTWAIFGAGIMLLVSILRRKQASNI